MAGEYSNNEDLLGAISDSLQDAAKEFGMSNDEAAGISSSIYAIQWGASTGRLSGEDGLRWKNLPFNKKLEMIAEVAASEAGGVRQSFDLFKDKIKRMSVLRMRVQPPKKQEGDGEKSPIVTGEFGDKGRYVTIDGRSVFIETKESLEKNRKRRDDEKAPFVPKNMLDHAIVDYIGNHKKMVEGFKPFIEDAYKVVNQESKERSNAIKSVLGAFGHTGKQAYTFIQKLRKQSDYDKVPGFDEMAEYAAKYHPELLASTAGSMHGDGDFEQAVFDGLKEGFDKQYPKHSPAVLEMAAQMAGSSFFDESSWTEAPRKSKAKQRAEEATATDDDNDNDGWGWDTSFDVTKFSAFREDMVKRDNAGKFAEKRGSKTNAVDASNATKHKEPKANPLTIDSKPGDSFKTAKYGLKEPMDITIKSVEGGKARISNGFMGANVPVESLEQLYSDTTGDYSYLKVFGESKSPEVNKILEGKAKFIGKGADGVVHDVGDGMVVKSSTTVPYHTVGGGDHLTPNDAVESFAQKINLEKEMHAAGIPSVMKTRNGMHGDKIFSIRPKLDTSSPLSDEQVSELEASIKAMHEAGYSINDEVQVGIAEDGKVYHFDLGQASSGAGRNEIKSDLDRLRAFKEENAARRQTTNP
jgi:hypothetical protein